MLFICIPIVLLLISIVLSVEFRKVLRDNPFHSLIIKFGSLDLSLQTTVIRLC